MKKEINVTIDKREGCSIGNSNYWKRGEIYYITITSDKVYGYEKYIDGRGVNWTSTRRLSEEEIEDLLLHYANKTIKEIRKEGKDIDIDLSEWEYYDEDEE